MVRIARSGGTGRITLDRPAKLNALTPEMIAQIAAQLDAWERDPGLHVVLLEGTGPRGFCAGGDLALLRDFARTDDDRARRFWAEEYRLDATIARFPKPAVAFMSGIVMGLADAFVPESLLPELAAALTSSAAPRDAGEVRATIDRYATEAPPAPLIERRALIDRTFAHESVEGIVAALLRDGSRFALATARAILSKSPTSLKLTLRALREARTLDALADCLRLEYRLMSRLLGSADFYEGLRAVVIDKDRTPRWQPDTLEGVSTSTIERHFAPFEKGELAL